MISINDSTQQFVLQKKILLRFVASLLIIIIRVSDQFVLFCSYPDNVVNAFVMEARKAGVDIFRVFDSLNYVDNIKFGLDAVHAAGGVAEGTICYTGDITNPERKKV